MEKDVKDIVSEKEINAELDKINRKEERIAKKIEICKGYKKKSARWFIPAIIGGLAAVGFLSAVILAPVATAGVVGLSLGLGATLGLSILSATKIHHDFKIQNAEINKHKNELKEYQEKVSDRKQGLEANADKILLKELEAVSEGDKLVHAKHFFGEKEKSVEEKHGAETNKDYSEEYCYKDLDEASAKKDELYR